MLTQKNTELNSHRAVRMKQNETKYARKKGNRVNSTRK